MKKSVLFVLFLIACFAAFASAQNPKKLKGTLEGFEEVPSISTQGVGDFVARISNDETTIEYELSYSGLEGTVTQAHLHFGEEHVNGGITVFLCTNLANGPAGTQECPVAPATITGAITATDVSPAVDATAGARAQGLETGELAELIQALRDGRIYVNVHSEKFPGGEIRSQIHSGRRQRETE